ncbi:MAG: hypothetical protein ACK52I_07885 [Pseudomonadota bacterium]|jgi:hypothetical protein
MEKYINRNAVFAWVFILLILGCGKSGDTPAPTPPTPPTPPPTPKTCIISSISQQNSGSKSEFSLNIQYDGNLNPIKIGVYDSSLNVKLLDANLTYVTSDSVRLDPYQYFKLDASKRVVVFVTKEDIKVPTLSDNYRFEYKYSSDGYLTTKLLFINGSNTPQYTTDYSYSNGLLVSCSMTASTAGNKKVLESTLTYDATLSPKTMIYTFPDGFESSLYSAALNFGIRPSKPLTKVVTKIYDPVTSNLLDTWTTNYSGYNIDSNGYLSNGLSTGDQQQGIFLFYGKTNFIYQCK